MNGKWKKKVIAMAAALVMCSTTATSIGVSANDYSAEDILKSIMTNSIRNVLQEIPVVGDLLEDIFEDTMDDLNGNKNSSENNIALINDNMKKSFDIAIKSFENYIDIKDYNERYENVLVEMSSTGELKDAIIAYNNKNYESSYEKCHEFEHDLYGDFIKFGNLITNDCNLVQKDENMLDKYFRIIESKYYLNSEAWADKENFIEMVRSIYEYGCSILCEGLVYEYKAIEKNNENKDEDSKEIFSNEFSEKMSILLTQYSKVKDKLDKEAAIIDLEKKSNILYNYKIKEYYSKYLKTVDAFKSYDELYKDDNQVLEFYDTFSMKEFRSNFWNFLVATFDNEDDTEWRIKSQYKEGKSDKSINKGFENSVSYSYGADKLDNFIKYIKEEKNEKVTDFIKATFYIKDKNMSDFSNCVGIYRNGNYNTYDDSASVRRHNLVSDIVKKRSYYMEREVEYYGFDNELDGKRLSAENRRCFGDSGNSYHSLKILDKVSNSQMHILYSEMQGEEYTDFVNKKFLMIEKASSEEIAEFEKNIEDIYKN